MSLCLLSFVFFRSSAVVFFLSGRDPHKREFWITRNNNNNNDNDNEKRKQKRDVYHDDDECDDDDVENVHANDGDDVFFENDSLEVSDKKDEQKLPRVLEKWWFSSTKSKSWGKCAQKQRHGGRTRDRATRGLGRRDDNDGYRGGVGHRRRVRDTDFLRHARSQR